MALGFAALSKWLWNFLELRIDLCPQSSPSAHPGLLSLSANFLFSICHADSVSLTSLPPLLSFCICHLSLAPPWATAAAVSLQELTECSAFHWSHPVWRMSTAFLKFIFTLWCFTFNRILFNYVHNQSLKTKEAENTAMLK